MTVNNLTILGETVYGQASGNYDGSSADFFSGEQKAVGYYLGQGSLQTVTIQVTGFVGQIKLWASLTDNLNVAHWSEVYTYGDGTSTYTDYHPVNITGNFVWIRAEVIGFDAGTINAITIAY